MKQQPDKLFQEKLAGYGKTVPASAWNRIESNLDKKNSKGLWLKVAASLLVPAVAAFLLWPKNISNETQQIAQHSAKQSTTKKETVDPVVVPETKNEIKPEQPAASQNEEQSEKADEKDKAKDKANAPAVQRNTPIVKSPTEQIRKDETRMEVNNPEISEEKKEQNPETIIPEEQITVAEVSKAPATVPANDDTGITLIYTVDEVNEKYLNKKSLAEATSDDKKPSTLRKLLEKAKDLKQNQDPFGELRQKKNEILAFNFKSDKQRSQNK